MTRFVERLLAVGIIAIVILVLSIAARRNPSLDSERIEINAPEQSLNDLGSSSDNTPFDAIPRWFSEVTVRITPTLGVSFDFLRPYTYTDGFVNTVKVSVDDTPSDEESSFTEKHRRSYETGIRIYFSATQSVGVTYGKLYEGDSVTTSFEAGFGLQHWRLPFS